MDGGGNLNAIHVHEAAADREAAGCLPRPQGRCTATRSHMLTRPQGRTIYSLFGTNIFIIVCHVAAVEGGAGTVAFEEPGQVTATLESELLSH